jgi:hypothetical protein
VNARSKNTDIAREEVRAKLDALRNGKVPESYKEIIKTKKQYTSK